MLKKIKDTWKRSELIDKLWVGGIILGSIGVLIGGLLSFKTPLKSDNIEFVETEDDFKP